MCRESISSASGLAAIALWLMGTDLAAAGHPRPVVHWGPAAPVETVNTESSEGCPIETSDGLSLLFASTRGDLGVLDIWVADRTSIEAPWQTPRKLEMPVNSDDNDFCPLPAFGRSLLFVSERDDADACGGGDMYLSRQSPAGGWSEPVNLGCAPKGPNTPGAERSPSVVETWYGTFLFYSTNGGADDHDIYVSRLRKNGTFGRGRVVKSLSSEYDDFMPNVREREQGGFEVVFNSNRPSGGRGNGAFGGQDVYASVAWFVPGPWKRPRNLGRNVNTAGDEQRATLSGDGKRLVFGRDGDIYVSKRRR
jgi:hypothetical protein